MNFTDQDKTIATAIETAVKAATTEGVPGFADAVMTPAEYTPSSGNPNLPRDFNRETAIGTISQLAFFPTRLPIHVKTNVPPANQWTGALIYVSNGAAGAPIVAFSNGSAWLRVDTNTPIS